jgi:hypothetical protein
MGEYRMSEGSTDDGRRAKDELPMPASRSRKMVILNPIPKKYLLTQTKRPYT